MSFFSWVFLATFISLSVQAKNIDLGEKLRSNYQELLKQKYTLLPHKGTYLLPVSYNNNPNQSPYNSAFESSILNERGRYVRELEAEIQFSFTLLTNKNIFNTDFSTFLGYTQRSWWQVYNSDWSKPFRESNYEPEIFARKVFNEENKILGFDFVAYDIGYVHQSNGQSQELSRSWDRFFLRTAFLRGRMSIITTFWYRIPDKSNLDDNPDIFKYLGYGNIRMRYALENGDIGLLIRPGEKYSGADLTYSYPWKQELRFYLKATYGYGSSLIDYNNRAETIGIGITLNDPLNYNH